MEVELLEKIVKNMVHKTSFQITVSGNESSFNTILNPALELDRDKEYKIALVNLETYDSFPNIDETNNVFVYSPDNGNLWVKIKILEGSYEIDDINNTIQHEMEKRGHHDPINKDYYIHISANSNTLKSVLAMANPRPGGLPMFFPCDCDLFVASKYTIWVTLALRSRISAPSHVPLLGSVVGGVPRVMNKKHKSWITQTKNDHAKQMTMTLIMDMPILLFLVFF